MIPVLLALCAGTGIYLLYTSPSAIRHDSGATTQQAPARLSFANDWLTQAGLGDLGVGRAIGMGVAIMLAGSIGGWILFGGVVAPLIASTLILCFSLTSWKSRHQTARSQAAEAWPRMIEEIRLLCGSLGKPIPQALLEVGKQGPQILRPAFVKAEREWLMSTDFSRSIAILKDNLADPTADATCETLLVAHGLGGSDVHKRLAALAEDRRTDLVGRKTAQAKQSGVRFARRFVLIVPLGMALAGMSIGNGRAAYATVEGQIGVAFGLLTLAACWWWAGRLIHLPAEERVFRG